MTVHFASTLLKIIFKKYYVYVWGGVYTWVQVLVESTEGVGFPGTEFIKSSLLYYEGTRLWAQVLQNQYVLLMMSHLMDFYDAV